jgi:predicted phosphodiesterase
MEARARGDAMKKWLIVPDTHIPFENKYHWALLLKTGQYLKPHGIVTLGDFVDCYSVSAHDRNPTRVRVLDEEIIAANERLTELQSLRPKEQIFIEGNHEDRLARYLMQKAPELFNMVKMQDLLKLKDRGVKFVPYRSHTTVGRLHITHEAGNCGAYAHYKALDTFQANIIIGHTHRLGYAVVGNAKGKAHVGAMVGWLGDVNKCDYMHKVKALRDWANGFGIGYEMTDGSVHVQPVPIVNGRVIVEGREIKVGT